MKNPGVWREPHRDVKFPYQDALQLWADAAIPVLENVASQYNGYIFYKDLQERLFTETGVHTTIQLPNWIGKPLGAVLHHCHERGLPALSALVVRSGSGMVGEGFNEYLRIAGREVVTDPLELEWVAAEERLKCYQRYCSEVPANAEASLTREYGERVSRRKTAVPQPLPACTSCGMVLPRSMQCDYCDD